MNNYVGVDIAKRDFFACLSEATEAKRYSNSERGIKEFLSYLKKSNFHPAETFIGVESTGSYHLRLSLRGTEAGYSVKVINPLIVKKQNQTQLRRVKNDPKYARLIRYCLVNGAGYVFQESQETIILKSLIRQRCSLTYAKLNVQRQQLDIAHKEDCIKAKINSVYGQFYRLLQEKIKRLEKELARYRPQEQQLLRTIPGVGPITAVSFLSEVGDIHRFKSAKQLVAYIGLDPRTHLSGTSIHGKGYITKRGNKILRGVLFNAASVAVQRENMFQTFFKAKRSEGKPY